jgi:two-component system chemotaxis sensor kinase CheA
VKAEQKEAFQLELLDLVRALEAGLLGLEQSASGERIAELFRHAHNIKSAAAMLGLSRASSVAHEMETVLEELRGGQRDITAATISKLLTDVDTLVAVLTGSGVVVEDVPLPPPPPPLPPASVTMPPVPSRRFRVALRLLPDALRNALDPLLLLAAVADLGQVVSSRTVDSKLPGIGELDPTQLYLEFELVLDTTTSERELRALFLFAEGSGDIDIAEQAPPAAHPDEPREPPVLDRTAQTLQVSVRRVDALVQLATELSAATAHFEQLRDEQAAGKDGRLQVLGASIRRLASRIHEAALTIRLVPVAPTFTLLRRYVRDEALRLGKSVEMVHRGEHTEVDKLVAERLFDPLKHLVRNALAHGIETPAERLARGKPARGMLSLEARQEHGRVVLDVRDDGRGLDLERIRQTARARGLLAADAELGDAEAAALIFLPGFSTAAELGELSGRGVGLDVVNRSVLDLGGDLRVRNQPGAGVTFTLSVPLTLAMIEGLVLRCGGQRLVVPLDVVRTLARPQPGQLTRLPGSGEVLRLPDVVVPLVRLGQVLGLQQEAAPVPRIIVVVHAPSGMLGLCVDEALAQEPILLKGFHRALRMGAGVLAAAVISDGSIALVLDIAALDKVVSGTAAAVHAATPAVALMRE